MKIYTKTGDSGSTGLYSGKRVQKDHLRIQAYGALDELNAALGFATSLMNAADLSRADGTPPGAQRPLQARLTRIQSELFVLGAELANPTKSKSRLLGVITEKEITLLEREIDKMEKSLTPLKNFILPAGTLASSALHLARTICRRAERQLMPLHRKEKLRAEVLAYVNRLSDYLFVAAREANHLAGIADTPWNPANLARSSQT